MFELSAELQQLSQQFPLPGDWKIIDFFEDTSDLIPNGLQMRGLVARNELHKETATAAASEAGTSPTARAYFELIERISILEAMRSPTLSQHFPKSSDPTNWTYAKSNGVALYSDRKEAQRRALAELIERERILRSWSGFITPQRKDFFESHSIQELRDLYHVQAFAFDDSSDALSEIHVAACFIFPKTPSAPFVYGFGAAGSPQKAQQKAADECLQRLGFLWGEEWSEEPLPFAPTPDYHQEFYARPEGLARIRNWLGYGHQQFATAGIPDSRSGHVNYIDITPDSLRGLLYVMKATSEGRETLAFGKKAPDCNPTLPEDLWIHPLL